MNKKGEDMNIGLVIMIAVVAIVGAVLLVPIAQFIGEVTNTYDVANASMVATNGTTQATLVELEGKSVSDVVIYNGSDDIIIGSGNYSVSNNVVIDGSESSFINVSADATGSIQAQPWNISYTTQPTTYDSSSGGRTVAGLIVLFFALAIAVAMMIPTMRSKILESMGR